MNKFIFAMLGISLIIFGVGICFDPTFYDSRHGVEINLTGFNIQFGIFSIFIGGLLMWATFRKNNKR